MSKVNNFKPRKTRIISKVSNKQLNDMKLNQNKINTSTNTIQYVTKNYSRRLL